MKYYMRSWYRLMQEVELAGEFTKIPDLEYTIERIRLWKLNENGW